MAICFLFIVSSDEENLILNYPSNFLYKIYFLVLVILTVMIISIKRNDYSRIKDQTSKVIFFVVHSIFIVFVSYALAKIVLWPLSIYNINYSQKNKAETVKCELTYLYYSNLHPNNCKFNYSYHGKSQVIFSDYNIIKEIYYNNNDYQNYRFVAKVRKGLWDTYCIESWELQHK